MMEWLTKRGVVYDSRSLKAEIFLTVKAQNAKPTYLTDTKAAEFGFDVIRLPALRAKPYRIGLGASKRICRAQ